MEVGARGERQVGRVSVGAFERGLRLDVVVSEVGSGLNGRRTKFHRLLSDPGVGVSADVSVAGEKVTA